MYSEELSEFSLSGEISVIPPLLRSSDGLALPLKLLMLECITRRASNVEENGSSSASSLRRAICSRREGRGSILRTTASSSWRVLSCAESVRCMMDASLPRSMLHGPQPTTVSASDTGDWEGGGREHVSTKNNNYSEEF